MGFRNDKDHVAMLISSPTMGTPNRHRACSHIKFCPAWGPLEGGAAASSCARAATTRSSHSASTGHFSPTRVFQRGDPRWPPDPKNPIFICSSLRPIPLKSAPGRNGNILARHDVAGVIGDAEHTWKRCAPEVSERTRTPRHLTSPTKARAFGGRHRKCHTCCATGGHYLMLCPLDGRAWG